MRLELAVAPYAGDSFILSGILSPPLGFKLFEGKDDRLHVCGVNEEIIKKG